MNDKDKQLIHTITKHYLDIQEELLLVDDSFEIFCKNKVVAKAIKLDLIQIGENINSLSLELKNRLPYRDLRGIIDTRNFIVHGYASVNDSIIWNSVHEDLPRLIKVLLK